MDRETVTDALRFWELRRIPYNLALIAIVVATVGVEKVPALPLNYWGTLGVLAVVANVLYCAAYPVDLFVQMSAWRASWRQWRIALWFVGMFTAGWLTYSFCSAAVT